MAKKKEVANVEKPLVVHLVTQMQCFFGLAQPDGQITDRRPFYFELDLLNEDSFKQALDHFRALREELAEKVTTAAAA